MGYVIGIVIGIPIFIFVGNFFFFRGNAPNDIEIEKYIQNSKNDTIILPHSTEITSKQYIKGLSRRGRPSGFLWSYIYFDNKYKKFLSLQTFLWLDENSQMRGTTLGSNENGDKMSVHINQLQLNNSKYGTKENPVPVFPIDIILEPGQSSWEARGYPEDPFHVSDELNKIFVEQYLKHFMPKEEFKEMFEE
ncbi:hypothetical protein [Frigoriflavimonas asaccharolytica]|uniref:DUF8188 domain-containing protein n=2 Tax=Frigoriflavimonas asaccharolytica TaxID=2735899 RepID=A0A8J8GE13_9FLAO|nr:hypothetical protein [Frigoriflavimonas asaccharolytica]NRS94117.1 hypothetical protein [Frigoriflavimonas asaccharolytica]